MRRFRLPLRVFSRLTVLPAILAFLLIFPQFLFARAGGGEGYSGGGGGGGGGGHGGGGTGWIVYLLLELFIHHPLIGLVLIVIVAIIYFTNNRNLPPGQSSTNLGSAPIPASGVSPQTIQRLRANDPNFDAPAFYRRVELAFGKIQMAWCSQ